MAFLMLKIIFLQYAMACCAAFHGRISEIPNISVDNFTNKDVSAYFLSHTHSDHTQGLYDCNLAQTLKRNNALIYMTVKSAAIVKYEAKCKSNYGELDEIIERIQPLELGTTSVTLPPDPKRKLNETEVFVTLISAGHSFGSVMFLFKANSKTVLYTGDFRTSVNDVCKLNQLHDKGAPIHIDTLYIDTTFIDSKYANFPKRSTSVAAAVHEIDKWLKIDKNNRVAVKTSAKFGYEYVYNELYDKLGCKVYVDDMKWKELYSNLITAVPGVTNTNSRIHLCWPKHLKTHTKCINFEPLEKLNFLYIHLSAQKWSNFQIDDNPLSKVSENEIDVCFSTHCSSNELLYFISYFDPKRVIGFPNAYESEVRQKKFDDEFSLTPKKARLDGERKMDRTELRKMFDF